MSKKQSQTTQEAFQELQEAFMNVAKPFIIFCAKHCWKLIAIALLFSMYIDLMRACQ